MLQKITGELLLLLAHPKYVYSYQNSYVSRFFDQFYILFSVLTKMIIGLDSNLAKS